MIIENEFTIRKFAKKHVHRLRASNSLWDVIELMNDFQIRHIPIVEGMTLKGVINPTSLMHALQNYTDPSTFDQSAGDFVSDEYILVHDDDSVLNIIDTIAKSNGKLCAILMSDGIFHGIFTEEDILTNDYLWSQLMDHRISSDTKIGRSIHEFSCIPSHMPIQHALRLMSSFNTEVVGIIDEHSKVLVGALSFMDIVRYLMFHYKELNTEIDFLWRTSINTIFPEAGLYISENTLLSDLRQQLYNTSSYLGILLNEENYPTRMISVHDIINLYVDSSGFPISNTWE